LSDLFRHFRVIAGYAKLHAADFPLLAMVRSMTLVAAVFVVGAIVVANICEPSLPLPQPPMHYRLQQ